MKLPNWLEKGFWITLRLIIVVFIYALLNDSMQGGALFKWLFALIGVFWAIVGFNKMYFYLTNKELKELTGDEAIRAFALPILLILGLMILVNLFV
ncbi:uncharacterized protein METZ01_LOCUS513082 [marine metagenome]|uniref:Uncharacterized protein n=1 Tax=marine metagenome TaxID=408172 RepID=A0A383EVV6_9ZZZZ